MERSNLPSFPLTWEERFVLLRQLLVRMWFRHFVILAVAIQSVHGVKDYLFKNCDDSGFCSRNRHFAREVRNDKAYSPIYVIDASTLRMHDENDDSKKNQFIVRGNIVKSLPEGSSVDLPFTLSLYGGDNLRFTVDEHRPTSSRGLATSRRYNETSNWAFSGDLSLISNDNVSAKATNNDIQITYGPAKEYTAILYFAPVKLVVNYNGIPQVVMNERNIFNLEHLRDRDDNAKLHVWPQESEYAMFDDSFKDSREDTLPIGPESVAAEFLFPGFNHLYGIPEHADSLALKDTTGSKLPYRLYNVDIFEYETESRMPMYGSIPLLIAVNPVHAVGVFWVNSADTFVDIDKLDPKSPSAHFMSENGQLDFLILVGPRPTDINRKYGLITGYASLPQLFALGYHQCRWNYNDERDVLDINRLFDEHNIPYDTIWLDIEYAEKKKYLTWDETAFPDVKRMLNELDRTGRNLVAIVDPHLKTNYRVSDELLQRKLTIKNPRNEAFKGQCWPGELIWIDSMDPNSQEFWDEEFSWSDSNEFMGGKSTNLHLWNDMNEPSVFDGPETTSPKDNLHYGNWEHRSLHNVFGLSFHELTFNSLKARMASSRRQRPFILTRSFFAGSQRTAAMWTGDNMSKWEYLKASIPMVLTSNVVGMPFAGADVGGFFGNPSKELLTRWYQTGIWYPFFRAHAHIDSRRREPWVAGEPYTSLMRQALQTRYLLLPALYTAFQEASTLGIPVMMPLFYVATENAKTYDIDDQFFLGNSGLMVKPVTDENANTLSVYIPDQARYYDVSVSENDSEMEVYLEGKARHISRPVDLSVIPMFLRGGSIIPRKDRTRRSSRLMARDPYTLVVALDRNRTASGRLYVDDGESYDYLDGRSLEVVFHATADNLSASVTAPNQSYAESLNGITIERIIVLGDEIERASIIQGGKSTLARVSVAPLKSTIHKADIEINSEWSIIWEFAKSQTAVEHDEL